MLLTAMLNYVVYRKLVEWVVCKLVFRTELSAGITWLRILRRWSSLGFRRLEFNMKSVEVEADTSIYAARDLLRSPVYLV